MVIRLKVQFIHSWFADYQARNVVGTYTPPPVGSKWLCACGYRHKPRSLRDCSLSATTTITNTIGGGVKAAIREQLRQPACHRRRDTLCLRWRTWLALYAQGPILTQITVVFASEARLRQHAETRARVPPAAVPRESPRASGGPGAARDRPSTPGKAVHAVAAISAAVRYRGLRAPAHRRISPAPWRGRVCFSQPVPHRSYLRQPPAATQQWLAQRYRRPCARSSERTVGPPGYS